ncbi:perivitellin-2 31 kDa subunit-like [Babylonia areolata]|uniref:perivitellin-2 31 kDa subunit-like n=1 Tax=Babylonia areolata TaxID=304850 RepID=UPI003FD03E31
MATAENCWKSADGWLSHVSVGPIGMWGVNEWEQIFHRSQTYQNPLSIGSSWIGTDGLLRQLDAGSGTVWGVNYEDTYFHRQNVASLSPAGTYWYSYYEQSIPLKWISVSPGGSLWGRDTSNQAVHFHNNVWQVKGTDIQRVDAGLAGVWVLNTTGQLLHRVGTYGDNGSPGTEWRALEGTFQSVASGRDLMVAVDMAEHVWLRTGVGPDTPTGLGWVQYPGFMKQVDVYQTDEGAALWGVDSAGNVFFSTLNNF